VTARAAPQRFDQPLVLAFRPGSQVGASRRSCRRRDALVQPALEIRR